MKDERLELAQTVGLELGLAQTVSAPTDAEAVPGARAPAPPDVPAAPAATGDRFALGREIGRGGMGRVLEATDRQFRRTVAVKEMLPDGGPNARRRFVTEALVTGNLQHPGIPAVFERGERADGSSFYAMQLVSGRTLADALDETRSLEERVRLLPAVVKVAETVAYAHDRGVVHRDLKPENVLLGRHGEVFLLDWGIAKVRGLAASEGAADGPGVDGARTQVGSVMGSPMYMAPEQARGDTEAIDERTDVFALGTMLYHVLTGRAPYQGKTVRELAAQAVEARPTAVAELVPGVHPELVAICAKAMERDPAARYRSALELAAALEGFQSQAARQPASRMVTRVQSVGLGAVVLMALGLVGLGLYGVVLVIRLGGIIAGCALFATVVSFALAAVEVRRSGQAKLVGVGLAVALVTLCVAVAEVLWGSIQTLGALGAWPGSPDAADLLRAGAAGLAEAAYSPLAALPLAVAQVLVWALVARRNALRDEAKGAQVGRHRPG